MLLPIRGRHKYCGPAAWSAIFGGTTDAASRTIAKANGRKRMCGVSMTNMIRSLEFAGAAFRVLLRNSRLRTTFRGGKILAIRRDTLAQWLRCARPGYYFVGSDRHWIAVYVFDGETMTGQWSDSGNREPLPLSTAPKKMVIVDILRLMDVSEVRRKRGSER